MINTSHLAHIMSGSGTIFRIARRFYGFLSCSSRKPGLLNQARRKHENVMNVSAKNTTNISVLETSAKGENNNKKWNIKIIKQTNWKNKMDVISAYMGWQRIRRTERLSNIKRGRVAAVSFSFSASQKAILNCMPLPIQKLNSKQIVKININQSFQLLALHS